MSEVTFIRAWPRDPATGAEVAVRIAGGGAYLPYRLGADDYRAGVVNRPRFTAALSFGDTGWSGGTVPATAAIGFAPSDAALRDQLASYFWRGARIEIDSGDETTTPPRVLTGSVADITLADGQFQLTVADSSKSYDRAALGANFAGTGGLEGYAGASGRAKRRSWGRVRNVEGRLIDSANNIYEFSDPAYPLQAITALRDKGRDGTTTTVAWAGSAAATLAALIASAPVAGGGCVAPSIACAKWWTQPAGPLTADLQGEIGTGYVNTVAAIVDRLVTLAGGGGVSNLTVAVGWRGAEAGIHVEETSETWSSIIDRLLLGASLVWSAGPTGTVTLSQWAFGTPAASLNAIFIAREGSLPPTRNRTLTYRRNHRVHNDGEISAALDGQIIAGNANRVPFSQYEAGTTGSLKYDPSNICAALLAATDSGTGRRLINVGGTATLAGQFIAIGTFDAALPARAACTGSERLSCQADLGYGGAIGARWLYARCWDAADAIIAPDILVATPPAATSFPTNIAGFIVTPPGAVKIGLFMQGQTSGAGAIDLRMARPMITGATASQTEHPAFSPGPNSFDAATRNNVTYATTAPAAPADGDLWVDTSGTYAIFKLRSGGAWETGANALSAYNALSGTPVALADINTTESSKLAGIASGATRNRWYVATSDPGGADGDGWKDTSTTPPRFRLKAAGSWIDVSSLVTDTAQITDGAQLGLTALWTGVTGTAKPQDNADVTANSQLTLVCNPLFEFDADYTGAISTALPFDRRVKAMKGTTDVSTTTSFALTGGGGLALSINNTAGDANRGVLTVGATTTGSGTVTVVGTFAGGGIVNLPLTFTKTNGPAPAGGGSGATSASILSSGAIGGTSMAAFGSEVIVRSDGAGKIRVSIDAYASGGTVTNGMRLLVAYATSSGGSLTDLFAETAASYTNYAYYGPGDFDEATASLALTQFTLPAANTDYYFRVKARKTNAVPLSITSMTVRVQQ